MTRAIDRLIVSGAIDPIRTVDRSTPIGWVLERLDAQHGARRDEAPLELARDDALRAHGLTPQGDDAIEQEDEITTAWVTTRTPTSCSSRSSTSFRRADHASASRLPELAAIPTPPARRAPTVAPRALALYERCSYRFYAERVLGLPPRVRAAGESGGGGGPRGDRDRRRRPPSAGARPARRSRLSAAGVSRRDGSRLVSGDNRTTRRVAGLVDAYCASPLAARLASLRGARPERPFTFEHDGVLIRGRLDVLWHEGERALIVDYKSNALEGARSARHRRGRVPAAAARLRARVPAGRVLRGRDRVPVPRTAGYGRVDDVRTR